MLRLPLAAALLALAASASAQVPTDAERVQGWAERDGQTVFVFDPALYGLDAQPQRVVVTGAFRGWSDDMDDPAWQLAERAGAWTLTVDAASGPAPGTPFKFRVDGGRWLDPPADATNAQGGNLVFRSGETAPRLVAELRGRSASGPDPALAGLARQLGAELDGAPAAPTVWVRVEGAERPLTAGAYRIVRWDGVEVPVSLVLPHHADTAVLVPAAPLDPAQVHYVTAGVGGETLCGRARFDGLWRDLASSAPLGAVVNSAEDVPFGQRGTERQRRGAVDFRLFAPRADSVTVHLYDDRTGPAYVSVPMAPDGAGVWHAERGGTVGDWYDFSVYGPDGPGSAFTNQTGETVSDPYALVSDDSWGRARVWQDTFPTPRPVAGGRPAMEDVIAYEVHLQDFTDRLPLAEGVGPLEGFVTPGLTNGRGEAIGLDYLSALGVNTVHLMPVQEFLHYPDSEWQAAFAGDPFMQAQGVATENYQWGYRTTHALAIESRFRSAADEPGRERERLAALVDTLHRRGMAVVVDVVFNHTGENMEGREQLLTFNGIDKWYAYRLDDDGTHIGAFGNEVKSENRPMVQRWLLDQLRQLVDVFGVDGFRIDLAGQTDEQTLSWLQAELGPDVLIYGEPWIGSNDPDYEANPDWDWYKADSPITFFQDDARNAFKGTTADPTPAPASRGFAGGDSDARDAAARAVANDYPEEPTPNAGINYLDIHDNWALADRFAACQAGDCAWDGRAGVRAAEMRIAAALLLTSLGPVVIHGGTEIARSKGLAPLPEEIGGQLVKTEMALAPIYIKGRGDTYNLRAANAFEWETVGQTEPVDAAAMVDWWRGLIALRLSPVGEVLRLGGPVPPGWVQVHGHPDPGVLMYTIGERVHVRINASDREVAFGPLDLPGDGWSPVTMAGERGVSISPADPSARRIQAAGREQSGAMGPWHVSILVRQD